MPDDVYSVNVCSHRHGRSGGDMEGAEGGGQLEAELVHVGVCVTRAVSGEVGHALGGEVLHLVMYTYILLHLMRE